MTLRPDTRRIWATTIDSLATEQSLAIFRSAMPNEAAICYRGSLRDTTYIVTDTAARDSTESRAFLLILTQATQAIQDSANQFHVFGPTCGRDAVAIGHSHPYALMVCDHSDPDANVLFTKPWVWASVVWCMNGEVQFLYQDSRRDLGRWRDQ